MVGGGWRARGLAVERRENRRGLDRSRKRKLGGGREGEAGKGADRAAHRATRVVVVAMSVVPVGRAVGVVVAGVGVAGDERQQAPFEIVRTGAGTLVRVCALGRAGEIEGDRTGTSASRPSAITPSHAAMTPSVSRPGRIAPDLRAGRIPAASARASRGASPMASRRSP